MPGEVGALLRAVRFNEVGRHDLAERALSEGLAQSPDDPRLHAELARTCLLKKDYPEAERVARGALAFDPANIVATSVLGGALIGLGRHAEAERVLLRGLQFDPNEPDLLVQYGALLYRAGHLVKAQQVIRRAIELEPENSDAHNLLTLILAESGDRRSAVGQGGRGISLDPAAGASHLTMGIALLQGGHPYRARRHLREALRIDPTDETAELFDNVDTFCRPPGIVFYWWGLLVDRLPGKQFALWIAFLVFLSVAPALHVPRDATTVIMVCYVSLALYTWIAWPLARLWVRIFPAR